MKVIIIVGIVVIVLAGIIAILFAMSSYGPKFDEVKHMLKPTITTRAGTKALVVQATGDPNKTVGSAFGLLFKAWFKVKNRPKGKNMPPPRARWPQHFETPREEWIGIYAIPLPPGTEPPADLPSKNGLSVEIRDWHYGDVAEILHVGPYASEDSTVAKLKTFITGQGYEICGPHEEEYLKGPTFMPSNPDKYLTVIRCQVRKKKAEKQ